MLLNDEDQKQSKVCRKNLLEQQFLRYNSQESGGGYEACVGVCRCGGARVGCFVYKSMESNTFSS